MKKIMLFGLICLFTLSNPALAQNEPEEINIPPGKWWQLPVGKDIAVNADEEKKLNDMFTETRNKMKEFRDNLIKERAELKKLLEKEPFDEALCTNQFKKMQDIRTDIASFRFKNILETRKLLGAERFNKLTQKFQERKMNRMKERREKREGFKKGMSGEKPAE